MPQVLEGYPFTEPTNRGMDSAGNVEFLYKLAFEVKKEGLT